jgi:hypothetical protein
MSDTTTDPLLQEQGLFALWVWATVRSSFFTLTPKNDGTTAVGGWPTGDALNELATGFASISDVDGNPKVTDVLTTLQTNLQTGNSGVLYPVTLEDGTITNAIINYGVALSATKSLYDQLGTLITPDYDPDDPTCRLDEIVAMIPSK